MALRKETLAFIGCGTMGEAMVNGLLGNRLVKPEQIIASHPRADRRELLAERYGIRTSASNVEAAAEATVVTLAIKPQVLDEVVAELRDRVQPTALVLTIVAGVTVGQLQRRLGTPRVVRVMPNTPGQIGQGISVWTTSDEVENTTREKVRIILSALGAEEYVTHENELDMATALSGTGPAYVFMFMEALVDAGVHLGFSRRRAQRLVYETMRGSVAFAMSSPRHPAELRNQVTSPGGTSAEAQYQLERGRIRTVLSDAVWAAYRRCVQLGEMVAPDHDGRPLRGSGNG
jgi:pyrroline-5-carboxylate reductase